MQVVLHTGAHMTDEDRLITCLVSNRVAISELGTSAPTPRAYRKLFRDLFLEAYKSDNITKSRNVLREALVDGNASDRLVLSNSSFFGTPKMAAAGGILYSEADTRIGLCREVFPDDEIEIFMSICNLATFLPATFAKTNFVNITDFLGGTDPCTIRWSDMLKRMRGLYPDIAITVWCNEDTPLIWGQIIRELAGVETTMPIKNEFKFLSEIMSEIGMKRFLAYLASHPGMTEIQKRHVIVAFLDKYADDSAIEEELDVPGWTEQLIDQLTDVYDEDVYAIQQIPGVTLITP